MVRVLIGLTLLFSVALPGVVAGHPGRLDHQGMARDEGTRRAAIFTAWMERFAVDPRLTASRVNELLEYLGCPDRFVQGDLLQRALHSIARCVMGGEGAK